MSDKSVQGSNTVRAGFARPMIITVGADRCVCPINQGVQNGMERR